MKEIKLKERKAKEDIRNASTTAGKSNKDKSAANDVSNKRSSSSSSSS